MYYGSDLILLVILFLKKRTYLVEYEMIYIPKF